MKLKIPDVKLEHTAGMALVLVRYHSGHGLTLTEATRLRDCIRNLDTLLAVAQAYVEMVPPTGPTAQAHGIVRRLLSDPSLPRGGKVGR